MINEYGLDKIERTKIGALMPTYAIKLRNFISVVAKKRNENARI